MKKSFVVVLAALFAVALVPQAVQAGVTLKGGFSLAKMTATPAPPFSMDNLRFYVGGLSLSVNLGYVSIQPEVLYTRMGFHYASGADSLEYRLDYVQVPVMLRINILPTGPVRPFICAGGYGSYLIRAKGEMVVEGTPSEEDLADMFQKYDYGVVGGAGLAFHLPGVTLTAEGRYNFGLMNILKDPAPGDSAKNRSIMILAGIGF